MCIRDSGRRLGQLVVGAHTVALRGVVLARRLQRQVCFSLKPRPAPRPHALLRQRAAIRRGRERVAEVKACRRVIKGGAAKRRGAEPFAGPALLR
eukprot:5665704-Alexandrium_andersonii.AAC.1